MSTQTNPASGAQQTPVEHTPGKWAPSTVQDHNTDTVIYSEKGQRICSFCHGNGITLKEAVANRTFVLSRLETAAERDRLREEKAELVAALLHAVVVLSVLRRDHEDAWHEAEKKAVSDALKEARAALAKASAEGAK